MRLLDLPRTGRPTRCRRSLGSGGLCLLSLLLQVDGHVGVAHRALELPPRGQRLHVLEDARLVEEVPAARRGDIFSADLVANPAGGLLDDLGQRQAAHEVRVVHRLPQPRQQLEDVRVVVQERPLLHVGVELHLSLLVQTLVKVLLLLAELECEAVDSQLWKLHIFRPSLLGSPQLGLVQHLLQLDHGQLALPEVPVPRDGVQDGSVEVRIVVGARAPAALAGFLLGAESPVQRLAIAALFPAKVVGVRVQLQESEEGVQLAHAVLQRRSRDAPLLLAPQAVYGLGNARGASLDLVGLV
mmetsp:Transcript_30526/g.65353  ORF Transcript_30526/g.65353 Transcript_30526/m.65353 type:complete len:299 (-) Transcript_30526:1089-1985(-)